MKFSHKAQYLLFGMGSRRKLLYLPGGKLLDALNLETLHSWDVETEKIDPAEYQVMLSTRQGRQVRILENEEGLWLEQDGTREILSRGRSVKLPRFEGNTHAAWLRALHSELLVNITPFGPVPNLWVYPRPWYRDAAMMLMCLRHTGNLALVEAWTLGLHKLTDRNNAGMAEADNLGQILYMLSLFDARKHPLIEEVLKAIPNYREAEHITGLTDGSAHPVYQTKWLKFGLESLGFDTPYKIPTVYDSYSSLFWMGYRKEHVAGKRFSRQAMELFPYLSWAEAHFHDEAPPELLGELLPPLTREGQASEAEYWRLKEFAAVGIIPDSEEYLKFSLPHTWHAAEIFLYLIEKNQSK
ncbi:MAG: hypothetical protein A2X49_16670 [Lentisphaerae bacterium GWF2_52_8]|nr:MAG: hypothetical protein A2X49_16670 [Lentisphaerae bacterium GWF2_52_8]